jgi:hypothetical protein
MTPDSRIATLEHIVAEQEAQIAALTLRDERRESELAALREQMNHEKAEREALQQIVVPPLKAVRQDLELNVEFITERLEALKARAAGEPAGLSADAVMEAFGMMADAIGVLTDRQVSFMESTLKVLRQLVDGSSDQQLRMHAIEQLLGPALEGTAKGHRNPCHIVRKAPRFPGLESSASLSDCNRTA